jgi:hypothetical protein
MIRFYQSQYPEENYVIKALYEGCPHEKELTHLGDYQPSDVAVVMGVYKKYVPASYARGAVIQKQKANKLDCLILETGYINRGDGPNNHYALGWNGLNGRADFKNKSSPPSRAKKLGVELKPWRDGEYILLAGQVPWDASVDFTNHREWLEEAANNIRAITGREIVFRPHPKGDLPSMAGCRYSKGPLYQDLMNAHCVVTFNSNTGVDAALDGVPVFAFDIGAMTYPIANKNWLRLENPEKPDRTQWLNNLAYCQWTPEEMRSGEAWEHIFPKIYIERYSEFCR